MKKLLVVVALVIFPWTVSYAATKAPAQVEVAFGNDCEELLIRALREARKEIKVAIFMFAKRSIADALIDRAQNGIKVTVKIDAHEAEFEYTVGLIERMQKAKITVEKIQMHGYDKMHHKFVVIDGKWVATGSFNWTKQASEENWENLVVIESSVVAQAFNMEWGRIKSAE